MNSYIVLCVIIACIVSPLTAVPIENVAEHHHTQEKTAVPLAAVSTGADSALAPTSLSDIEPAAQAGNEESSPRNVRGLGLGGLGGGFGGHGGLGLGFKGLGGLGGLGGGLHGFGGGLNGLGGFKPFFGKLFG